MIRSRLKTGSKKKQIREKLVTIQKKKELFCKKLFRKTKKYYSSKVNSKLAWDNKNLNNDFRKKLHSF